MVNYGQIMVKLFTMWSNSQTLVLIFWKNENFEFLKFLVKLWSNYGQIMVKLFTLWSNSQTLFFEILKKMNNLVFLNFLNF